MASSPTRSVAAVSSSPISPPSPWIDSPRSTTDSTSRPRRSLLSAHFCKKTCLDLKQEPDKAHGLPRTMDMAEVLQTMDRKKSEDEEEEEEEEDDDAEACESDGMCHIVDVTDMLHDMEQKTDDDDDEGAYGMLQTVHMDYLMELKTDDERDNGILLAVNTMEILRSMEQKKDNHSDNDGDARDCGMLQTVDMAKAVSIMDHNTDKNDEDELTDTLEPTHMMKQTTTDDDRPVVMVDLLNHTLQLKKIDDGGEEEGRIDRLSKSLPSPSSSWELFDEPGTPPEMPAMSSLPPPMAPKKSSKNRIIPLGKQRPRKLVFGDSESSDLPQEPMNSLEEDRSSGHCRLLLNEDAHSDLHRPDDMQEEDRSLGKQCNRRHLFGEDVHRAEPSDVHQVHMDLQEDRSLGKRHQISLLFGEDERDQPSAELHQNPLNLHGTRPVELHERPFGLQEIRPLTGKQLHRNLLFGEDEQQDKPSDIQQGPKETRKSPSSASSSSSSSLSVRIMQLR